jgi:hypothetical protein
LRETTASSCATSFALNGTEKRFEVGWDATANATSLTSSQPCAPAGGELEGIGTESQKAQPTSSKVLLDGTEAPLAACNIGGNNCFKLRDAAAALDFGVDWDGSLSLISVDTAKGYTP